MVVDCPYFREYRRALRPDEAHGDDAIAWVTVPHCLHKHSPAPLHEVAHAPGGWQVLRCGGSVDACQIPIYERLDI